MRKPSDSVLVAQVGGVMFWLDKRLELILKMFNENSFVSVLTWNGGNGSKERMCPIHLPHLQELSKPVPRLVARCGQPQVPAVHAGCFPSFCPYKLCVCHGVGGLSPLCVILLCLECCNLGVEGWKDWLGRRADNLLLIMAFKSCWGNDYLTLQMITPGAVRLNSNESEALKDPLLWYTYVFIYKCLILEGLTTARLTGIWCYKLGNLVLLDLVPFIHPICCQGEVGGYRMQFRVSFKQRV